MATLGVVNIPAPSYAWPKSIRASIFAKAFDTTGQVSDGQLIPGTEFIEADSYRFDFNITVNNTPTINTSTATQWGPNNSGNTNLTGSLFTNLRIGRCKDGDITMCSPEMVEYGVIDGTWNSDPTWGTGTDLQKFGVKLPPSTGSQTVQRRVNLNLGFGASSGETGLTTTFNNTANKSISNVEVGCDVSQATCMSDLSAFTFTNTMQQPGWLPVGSGISNLTASNIIDNLKLTFDSTSAYDNTTNSPNCTAESFRSCNLAIRFKNEAGAIYFNINSARFTYVPGPLPITAAFVAFGYSRKLRNRIKLPVS